MSSQENDTGISQQAKAGENGRRKRRWPIVAGVVAIVVACVALGFWVWHGQPSFCSAVCHEPMDAYVQNYYGADGATLAHMHEQKGETCLDCHEASFGQQIEEAGIWMRGGFSTDAQGYLTGSSEVSADEAFCGRCHDMAAVEESTRDWGGVAGVNPHLSHAGSVQCQNCHSAHGTSNMWCNTCHDWKVPEGWTSAGK
jgi:nitrate/TMAO reductase-like tetraheme cytochrome c subunit